MKTKLVALLTAFIMIFGVAPALASTPNTPDRTASSSAVAPTAAGRAIYISNSLYSTGSIKMCTGHNGSGTCYNVPRNSKSPAKVRSVYAGKLCLTMVNSRHVRPGTYWNTGRFTWGPHAAVTIC